VKGIPSAIIMPTPKVRNQSSSKPISDAGDGRVACYHRNNYKFRELKARSLAWFVQIAIRRDMRSCFQGLLHRDDPRVRLQGHLEIFNKLDELETLIRQRHIVGEDDLATIGLTLYNFPTLSHFFVAPKKQAFVREATVQELIDKGDYIRALLLKSRLAAYIPGDKNYQEASEEEGLSLVNQMTSTKVEEEAGLEGKDICKQKFLVVDMAAPVTILKQQFLKLLDREARLRLSPYDEWEEYGILPYLDLRQWEKHNSTKVKAKTRVELIYPNRLHGYGPKKVDETTLPHTQKLMDEKGPVFRGLLADASEEFWATWVHVREEDSDGNAAMAEEALARWFPRTFPHNFPDLERASRLFPDSRDGLQQSIERLQDRQSKLTLVERIRGMDLENSSTALLRTMEALRGKHAYKFPVSPEDDVFQEEDDHHPRADLLLRQRCWPGHG